MHMELNESPFLVTKETPRTRGTCDTDVNAFVILWGYEGRHVLYAGSDNILDSWTFDALHLISSLVADLCHFFQILVRYNRISGGTSW